MLISKDKVALQIAYNGRFEYVDSLPSKHPSSLSSKLSAKSMVLISEAIHIERSQVILVPSKDGQKRCSNDERWSEMMRDDGECKNMASCRKKGLKHNDWLPNNFMAS